MEKEIFIPIKNYEDYYLASSFGKIYSVKKNLFLKSRPQNAGYPMVKLYKYNVACGFTVHRLIASTFIPNPDNLP